MRAVGRVFVLSVLVTAGSEAQLPAAPVLRYEVERTIGLSKFNVRRISALAVGGTQGRIVVATEVWMGDIVALDSAAKAVVWRAPTGGNSDIGYVGRMGWVGDSLWIEDRAFAQVAILDAAGKVVRSIERPSWIYPAWSERRKYPLFSSMEWQSTYPDGTMLIVPIRPRQIFDTPQFDRMATHLVRTNRDGKILKTVARIPAFDGRLVLRDGQAHRDLTVPNFQRTRWSVSGDGKRILVVAPPSVADSGALRVTLLTEEGDTVFSRPVKIGATPIPPGRVDTIVSNFKGFQKYSQQWVQDTIRKLMPVYGSRLMHASLGADYSTWIWLRSDKPERNALVLAPNGEVVGMATFSPALRPTVYTVDRIWTAEPQGGRSYTELWDLVVLKRATTAARPARTAKGARSPAPGPRSR